VDFGASGAGNARLVRPEIDGATHGPSFNDAVVGGGIHNTNGGACVLFLDDGHYVEVQCGQDSGGAIALTAGQYSTFAVLTLLGT
jgi:hypothetical protein